MLHKTLSAYKTMRLPLLLGHRLGKLILTGTNTTLQGKRCIILVYPSMLRKKRFVKQNSKQINR